MGMLPGFIGFMMSSMYINALGSLLIAAPTMPNNIYSILIITIVIHAAFILHVIYSRRNTQWLWAIIFLPVIGCTVYFAAVIFTLSSHQSIDTASGCSVARGLDEVIKLAESEDTYEYYDQIRKQYQQSRVSLRASLDSTGDKNPDIMYMLAITEFGLLNFSGTKEILDELISDHPGFKNAEAHLLYAKTLEKMGDYTAAIAEYESLDIYYHAPDATYYLALLLKDQGETEKARECLKKIINYPDPRGKYFNSTLKEYKHMAKEVLAELH